MLIWDLELPKVNSGDLLAVFCTGAYNYAMASNYNRIRRPAVVFVKDGQAIVVVKRESFDDIVGNDVIPHGLSSSSEIRVSIVRSSGPRMAVSILCGGQAFCLRSNCA